MHQLSIIFSMLSIFFLSILAAPLPLDQSLDKREYRGRGTWFYDGLGKCGYWNHNYDSIVAISAKIYGSGSNCNKWVQITANGKTGYGQVRDQCQSCAAGDLDMSIGMFEHFDSLNVGVLSVAWNFMPEGWHP